MFGYLKLDLGILTSRVVSPYTGVHFKRKWLKQLVAQDLEAIAHLKDTAEDRKNSKVKDRLDERPVDNSRHEDTQTTVIYVVDLMFQA